MRLRNLKVGGRAGLGFSIIALLVLAMGVLALYQAKKMDVATEEIRVDWLPSVLSIAEVGGSLGRARALTLRSIMLTNASEQKRTMGLISDLNAGVAENLYEYETTIRSDENLELFRHFRTAHAKYIEMQAQVLGAVLASTSQAEAVRLANGPLAELSDAMMLALNQLISYNEQHAHDSAQRSRDAFRGAVLVIVVATVFIMLAMIFIALMLTRSIVSPLRTAVTVADRIASGDLTQVIPVSGNDEPAHLLRVLQTMQSNLRQTLHQISSTSDQLASASEKLHLVTEDTKQGLHQQGTEIEQAATAVSEMTNVTEAVANNAVTTANASKEADHNTREGRDKVNQALASIQQLANNVSTTSTEVKQLAESVNAISQVLVVIRSIADQTNLLALNAAIEAARAGEAGRGFAVVADEVRALAHRTQQSTAEIESMVEGIQSGTGRAVEAMNESQERTKSTLDIARAADDALDVIGAAMTAINQKNLAIARASEEQAHVVREVDRNLVNIRNLSAQTSSGANQTHAASQALSDLAVALNTMISKFKV